MFLVCFGALHVNAKQFGEDDREQPLYVVYKIHLLHVIHLQVNLPCFWYMDEFLDECGAVFLTNRLSFCNNKPTVFLPNYVLQFPESCMMFSPSVRRS